MVITQEHLFKWNIEQVLNKIQHDYKKEIMAAYEARKDVLTLEDWLSYNPEILGRYMLEQLNVNFNFEEYSEQ